MCEAGTQDASDAIEVELRLAALAVHLESALLAHGVRPIEDPVLPGRQTPEDARLHRLDAVEAQVGLKARERIRRHGRAFFNSNPDLVGPVDIVRRRSNQSETLRLDRQDPLSDLLAYSVHWLRFVIETAAEARLAGDHRVEAKVSFRERQHRFLFLVARQRGHVAAVASKREFGEGSGEA